MRFFFYLLVFIYLPLLFSCKVNYKQVNDVIKIKEAYIQQEIPGQQGMKPKRYLTIHLVEALEKSIMIDSLHVFNNGFVAVKDVQYFKQTLRNEIGSPRKLVVGEGVELVPSVIVYFKKGKEYYRQTIQPLQTKEPLYLP